jgi:tripartite-type tricarboxylate transporter receptor subunit TctC
MVTLCRFVLILMLTGSAALAAMAAEWPSRPSRFVVPFPAGGSTDVAARVVGDYLSRAFGQQIVVENKSGANGNIGIEYAAKSLPDGYTVLIATDAVSSNPHVYKMSFDPLQELQAGLAVCDRKRRGLAPSHGRTVVREPCRHHA